MCTLRNKALLLTLLLCSMIRMTYAQTAEQQLVKEYVVLLGNCLDGYNAAEIKKFSSLFPPNNNCIGDEWVKKYHITLGREDPFLSPSTYISEIGQDEAPVDNDHNRRLIKVELIGNPILRPDRETVYAEIKFSGGKNNLKNFTTVSNFVIKDGRIKRITPAYDEIEAIRNGKPLPIVAAQDNKPIDNPSKKPNKPSNTNNDSKQNKPQQTTPSQPQTVLFHITSSPDNVTVNIDGNYAGRTPLTKALVPGTHVIDASRWRCKDFSKRMELNSYHPDIHIRLKQLLNRKFEIYIEGNYLTGGMTAYGATLGGFLGNFNLEATYYMCLDKSEDIYWCDNERLPVKCNYTPDLIASAKLGYGIRIGTRFRITPQAGANYFTLKEEVENDQEIAQNVNSLNLLGSIRFSFAAAKHLKLSVTPEYHKNFKTSAGFEVLKETSPIIQDWTEGINIKFGLALFF